MVMSGSAYASTPQAAQIGVTTSAFTNCLTSSSTNVQSALNGLDNCLGNLSVYTFADSLVQSNKTVTLVNDSPAPGNKMCYGTNSSGVLGWYSCSLSSQWQGTNPVYISGLNVGIGTNDPAANLQVNSTLYVGTTSSNIIMVSPNGNCFDLAVNNSGNLSVSAISCPTSTTNNVMSFNGQPMTFNGAYLTFSGTP